MTRLLVRTSSKSPTDTHIKRALWVALIVELSEVQIVIVILQNVSSSTLASTHDSICGFIVRIRRLRWVECSLLLK